MPEKTTGKASPARATLRQRLPQIIAITLMFVSFTFIVLWLSGHYIQSWGILFCLVLLSSVAFHIWFTSYKPARRRPNERKPGILSSKRLTEELDKYFTKSSDMTALAHMYANAINNPSLYKERVVENLEPLNRAVRQKVTVMLKPATTPHEADLWLPLILPVKGELIDDLEIKVNGDRVAALNHREYLLLTVALFTSLVTKAQASLMRPDLKDGGVFDDHRDSLLDAADTGQRLIAARAPLNDGTIKEMNDCVSTLDRIAKLFPAKSDEATSLAAASGMVRTLAGHYAVLVAISKESLAKSNVIIEYERYLIPSLHLAPFKSFHWWLKDWFAALVGARPIFFEADLSNSATGQSYHLFILGPEGTFAAVQHMTPELSEFKANSDGEKVDQPHKRLQGRRGQRYFHLYTRSVPARIANKLRLSVKFHEVPPGSLATTAAAALAACALIFIAARVMSNTYPTLPGFSALVLSFPAAAGLIAGFEARSTSLVNGTLSSRWSSMITIAISLCASALAMSQSAKHLQVPVQFEILGIKDRLWQILAILALLNVLYALHVWVLRTLFFYFLATRNADNGSMLVEHGG